MDGPSTIPTDLGPNDVTLDADISSPSNPSVASAGPRVRLVDGSDMGVTIETSHILRRRLLVASLLLAMGFGVFIVWRLVAPLFGLSSPLDTRSLAEQSIVISVLAGSSIMLWRSPCAGASFFQVMELVVFGAPAAFFFAIQFHLMRECAAHNMMLPNANAPWVLLIFTYAMFIPNTWRRAAIVIGTMAFSPIVLGIVLWATDQACADLIQSNMWSMVVAGLSMILSGVSAIVGVHMINSLREEAIEAKQLGQYKLGRLLGSGGMGNVYLAEHLLMKRPCAIKVIRAEKSGDRRTVARFEREVRSTAKLSHWNNIDIFDYGRAADGTFYYVMEYLPGSSLRDLVHQFGPLPPGRVIHLLTQTCDALAEAHAFGLIHRDIKPANIFASQRGGIYDVAKLLDFGMVKPLATLESSEVTQDGSITGSPLFMSPEQATGEQTPDVRSDIYSLGVVAYYMLSGQPPFTGGHAVRVLMAHAHKAPKPLSVVMPTVPRDLEQVVMRCLAKAPGKRYGSATELRAALESCEHANSWSSDRAKVWWTQTANEHSDQTPLEQRVSVTSPLL